MAILEGIQIQNYRSLRDVVLGKSFDNQADPLPRIMAVIGANGVGKSSLLDALGFIGDCLANGVVAACDQPHRGGFERIRTLGQSGPIAFEIRFRQTADARPISYSLRIDADKHGSPFVAYERLRQRRAGQSHGQPYSFLELTNGTGEVWAGESAIDKEGSKKIPVQFSDPQVLGVSSLGVLADHPRITAFRAFLSGWYLSYFVPQLARSQPMAGAEPHLNRTGENLAKYLQFIERDQPGGLKEVLRRISKKVPGLLNIDSARAEDRRLLLRFHAKGYAEPFYQQDMSDGTLKLLAYLLLMEDPDPAPLIGIEEPENGLHHQLLQTLAMEFKLYAKKPRGPQVLLTTHSPNLVDALSPSEVWILGKGSDGFSSLTRTADIHGVQQMFDEGITSGSLWFSNHFETGFA
jgi:predicted ATPase